jgi:hypothetical protein
MGRRRPVLPTLGHRLEPSTNGVKRGHSPHASSITGQKPLKPSRSISIFKTPAVYAPRTGMSRQCTVTVIHRQRTLPSPGNNHVHLAQSPGTTTASSPRPGWPRSGGCWMTRSCGTAACSPSASAPLPLTSSSPAAMTRRQAAGCSRPMSRSWPSTPRPPAGTGRIRPRAAPRGDLVISDIHHELVSRGSVITARGPQGEPCIAATYRHKLGDYLRPALSLGLRVRRCEEPAATGTGGTLPVPATEIGDWWHWPWSLMNYLPSAARAAGGRPSLVIWHFQLPAA